MTQPGGPPNDVSLFATVSLSEDQASCQLGQDRVILNVSTGTYYGLDEVGARIWALLDRPRRVDELRDVLLDEYDVSQAACEQDLLSLLASLAGAGLIEVEGASAP